jgi:peptidoglycan/LPS O-acetylase OafA/YrhL
MDFLRMVPSVHREQQLRPLTSIRFLFALLVVVFHGQDTLEHGGFDNWPLVVRAVISHGYVGVGFFFVLSGFILAYSYWSRLDEVRDSTKFWGARFARIYPAYLLAFVIILPIGIYATLVKGDSGLALLTVGLQLTLLQSWVPYTALQWNGPAWSLSVEAFFYALFPLLFLKLKWWSAGKLLGTAAAAYLASQILALMGWLYGTSISEAINEGLRLPWPNEYARALFYMYFPIFRLPEFMFGMALGILFVRSAPVGLALRRCMILMGCLGFIFGFVIVAPLVPGEMISNGLLMPFLGLVLVGLANSPSRLFNHATFVQLGDASYSLYLLHIPFWTWIARADIHLWHWRAQSPKLFFFVYLTLVIAASLMSLHLIETPTRLAIRRWFRRRLGSAQVRAERTAISLEF